MFGSQIYVKRRLRATSPSFCEQLTELWLTNAWFTSPTLQPNGANVYFARIFIFRPLSPRNSLIVACDVKSRDKKHFRNVVGGTVKGDRDKRSRFSLFGLKASVYFEKKFSGREKSLPLRSAETVKNKKSSFMIVSMWGTRTRSSLRKSRRLKSSASKQNSCFWPKIKTWDPRLIIIFGEWKFVDENIVDDVGCVLWWNELEDRRTNLAFYYLQQTPFLPRNFGSAAVALPLRCLCRRAAENSRKSGNQICCECHGRAARHPPARQSAGILENRN